MKTLGLMLDYLLFVACRSARFQWKLRVIVSLWLENNWLSCSILILYNRFFSKSWVLVKRENKQRTNYNSLQKRYSGETFPNTWWKWWLIYQTLFICSIVIEALKGVEPDRRCFRMIGGVLVERTVKDVLPALENNKEQVRTFSCRTIRGYKDYHTEWCRCWDVWLLFLNAMQVCVRASLTVSSGFP